MSSNRPDNDSSRDILWQTIRDEAKKTVASEPMLSGFLHRSVLDHSSLGAALANLLATKLANINLPQALLADLFVSSFSDPIIAGQLDNDILAIYSRDSACRQYQAAMLYNKGFHALSAWRTAHQLWQSNRPSLALMLQNRISVVLGVDIHPAARIGQGVMFDHATGIVIGETAVVEDCVSIMQSVTLGGTGKESGDRHPKVRHGVLIGPGAKILGNIEIGRGSKVTAASVVLKDIPPHSLVAGVPATVIGQVETESPAEQMDQGLNSCREDQ